MFAGSKCIILDMDISRISTYSDIYHINREKKMTINIPQKSRQEYNLLWITNKKIDCRCRRILKPKRVTEISRVGYFRSVSVGEQRDNAWITGGWENAPLLQPTQPLIYGVAWQQLSKRCHRRQTRAIFWNVRSWIFSAETINTQWPRFTAYTHTFKQLNFISMVPIESIRK